MEMSDIKNIDSFVNFNKLICQTEAAALSRSKELHQFNSWDIRILLDMYELYFTTTVL